MYEFKSRECINIFGEIKIFYNVHYAPFFILIYNLLGVRLFFPGLGIQNVAPVMDKLLEKIEFYIWN